jgi:hypothetical protein
MDLDLDSPKSNPHRVTKNKTKVSSLTGTSGICGEVSRILTLS